MMFSQIFRDGCGDGFCKIQKRAHPNVPITRVEMCVKESLVSLARPKSATCFAKPIVSKYYATDEQFELRKMESWNLPCR